MLPTEAAKKPTCEKCNELAHILVECRDAIVHIPMTAVRLGNVSSSLDRRIEEALKPWEVKEGDTGYDSAI